MPEKLYRLLLKLYPEDFRRTYGDDALRLLQDRARDEKGFLSGLRLWLDLLLDVALSLPREYREAQASPTTTAQTVSGDPSFRLLAGPSANPAVLLVAGLSAAILFWDASRPLHAAGCFRRCSWTRFRYRRSFRAIWHWLNLTPKENRTLLIQWSTRIVRASRHAAMFRIARRNHFSPSSSRLPARREVR